MVIETICYTIGMLSLSAAVFVVSRELVKLRREITSMHIELTMACNALDSRLRDLSKFFKLFDSYAANSSELSLKRFTRLNDSLLELRNLCSSWSVDLLNAMLSLCSRFSKLKCLGKVSK